jgi:hypothetical protein
MARGDKGKTIKDLKNGTAANDHQVPVDGETEHGANWKPSGETLDELFALHDEAERACAEIDEKKRLAAKPFNDKIKAWKDKVKEARDQLVEDGYPTSELNILLAERKDKLKADRRRGELDETQKRRIAQLDRAWRDFASIPGGLGEAVDAREPAHAN